MAKTDRAMYTEQELKDRFIEKGRCPQADRVEWNMKKSTYNAENIWGAFNSLKESFYTLYRDADGVCLTDKAHRSAQYMIDAFLIRRSRGENVKVPTEIRPVTAIPTGEESADLIDGADFANHKQCSENDKLRWVFENIQVSALQPSDAPSAGTWALLLNLRDNPDQVRDFYKTLWPKLMAKEDAEKGGKLQDDGKSTIELIERLERALPEED